jgi:hypothetical protein
MFINIITPCSRPENLLRIAESINIPKENYKWYIVFDAEVLPKLTSYLDFNNNVEMYAHKDLNSIMGNSQRNFALDLVDSGYVYFQDDDTLMHQDLWNTIKDLSADFISFDQAFTNGTLRLKCGRTDVGHIDSHNFIVSKEIIGDTRWKIDDYCADGIFADACAKKTNDKIFIDKILSIYNQLRP